MLKWGRSAGIAIVVGVVALDTWANGIFTCIDAKGRKLTSDRPISECTDREQVELNPSGTVRRKIGPSFTAQERAEQDARERKLAEEQARVAEDRRRNRALLIRYPSQASHDKERREALAQIDDIIASMNRRIAELLRQRTDMDGELEFYKSNPAKVPAVLKQQIEDNARNQALQKQAIVDRENEKKRINARFDDELQKLRSLWAPPALATTAAGPAQASAYSR